MQLVRLDFRMGAVRKYNRAMKMLSLFTRFSLVAVMFTGLWLPVAGQQASAPSQPATYVTNADLMAALQKATAANPAMSSANIKNSDQYRINIVKRGRGAGALAHVPGTELHYILEGAGTLVTG